MKKAVLYKWHRRIALAVLVPLLLFGLSGILHPVMRLTAPQIAHPRIYPQHGQATYLHWPLFSPLRVFRV